MSPSVSTPKPTPPPPPLPPPQQVADPGVFNSYQASMGGVRGLSSTILTGQGLTQVAGQGYDKKMLGG